MKTEIKNKLVELGYENLRGYKSVRLLVEEGNAYLKLDGSYDFKKFEKKYPGLFEFDKNKKEIVLTNKNFAKIEKEEEKEELEYNKNTVRNLREELEEIRKELLETQRELQNYKEEEEKKENEKREKRREEENKERKKKIEKYLEIVKIEEDDDEYERVDMYYPDCRESGIEKEIAKEFDFEKWTERYVNNENFNESFKVVRIGHEYYKIL